VIRVVTRVQTATVAVGTTIVVGGIRAWAFNPDSGKGLRSLVLWRIFGIASEVGFVVLALLAVVKLVAVICGGVVDHE
jgi:hypothetical protein